MTAKELELSGLVGRVINDKYRLIDKVAEGGMAVVFKAEHIHLGEIYAIKIIKHSLSSQDEMLQRFKREFKLTQAVQRSPYIIRIFDFGMEPGIGFFYAMELLHGELLTSVFNPFVRPLPSEKTARLICQICEALAVVHDEKVIHRDIKPDNIFLHHPPGQEKEMIKLLDFGIARKTSFKATMLTSYGRVIGTPEYMSPEQCKGPTQEQYERGESHLDGRSDIYSLGILFYEGLTGQVPFPMEGDNPTAAIPYVMKGHVKKPPLPPSKLRPDIVFPLELENVVLKALEKLPENRFQTMREFRDAILACYPHLAGEFGIQIVQQAHSREEFNTEKNMQIVMESKTNSLSTDSTSEMKKPDWEQLEEQKKTNPTQQRDYEEKTQAVQQPVNEMQTSFDVQLPEDVLLKIQQIKQSQKDSEEKSSKESNENFVQNEKSDEWATIPKPQKIEIKQPASSFLEESKLQDSFDHSATIMDSQLHTDQIKSYLENAKKKDAHDESIHSATSRKKDPYINSTNLYQEQMQAAQNSSFKKKIALGIGALVLLTVLVFVLLHFLK